MEKHKPTGQSFQRGHACLCHAITLMKKQPNLKVKTWSHLKSLLKTTPRILYKHFIVFVTYKWAYASVLHMPARNKHSSVQGSFTSYKEP